MDTPVRRLTNEILNILPRHGPNSKKYGQPLTEEYRDIERKLQWFSFSIAELELIKNNLSKHIAARSSKAA